MSVGETTPLPTRERQRLDTRRRILEAALAQFTEVGVAATTIETIIRNAGVTRPTFYAHFATKDEVIREWQKGEERRSGERLREALADTRSLREVLRILVRQSFALHESTHPLLRREVWRLEVQNPRSIAWEDEPYFGFITQQIAAAQEREEIRGDLAPAEVAYILFGSLVGFSILESRPLEERREAALQTIEILLDGLAPRAG